MEVSEWVGEEAFGYVRIGRVKMSVMYMEIQSLIPQYRMYSSLF